MRGEATGLPPHSRAGGRLVDPSGNVSGRRTRVSVPIMEASSATPTTSIVVMGVSGSGKSTVAAGLAERLGWEFAEGDDFHPAENVAKMRAGTPLDDDDRWPWLRALAGVDRRARAGGALRRRHLFGAQARLPRPAARGAPLRLVRPRRRWTPNCSGTGSRTAAATTCRRPCWTASSPPCEPLGDDEPGADISGAGSPDAVVEELLAALASSAVSASRAAGHAPA